MAAKTTVRGRTEGHVRDETHQAYNNQLASDAQLVTNNNAKQPPTSSKDCELDRSGLEKPDTSVNTSKSCSPCPSEQGQNERSMLSFSNNDPLNPYNFSMRKKLFTVAVSMMMVMNSTIGSSLAAGATQQTSAYFNVHDDELLVLPVSIYLVGYVVGYWPHHHCLYTLADSLNTGPWFLQ